jgi:hypothetical protein
MANANTMAQEPRLCANSGKDTVATLAQRPRVLPTHDRHCICYPPPRRHLHGVRRWSGRIILQGLSRPQLMWYNELLVPSGLLATGACRGAGTAVLTVQ